ncbi:MAG: arginine repressor [Defluviitaleaceae bacterium]|nr:arginine repressor [Defluviitaleaceae bacterium]
MKSSRHAAILKLIQDRDISSQGDLTQALAETGFNAAQSTISRDIRELGLSLERYPAGLKYVASAKRTLDVLLKESLVSATSAGHMLVIRTRSGMAMAVALALDEMEFEEILGSVAGDDTVLCVTRTEDEAKRLAKSIG